MVPLDLNEIFLACSGNICSGKALKNSMGTTYFFVSSSNFKAVLPENLSSSALRPGWHFLGKVCVNVAVSVAVDRVTAILAYPSIRGYNLDL